MNIVKRNSPLWTAFGRNNAALVGLSIFIFFVLIALFGPLIVPYDPAEQVGPPFAAPSAAFLLGTNDAGQDIFSELIMGTRVSLLIGILASLLGIGVGCVIGIISGYFGGFIDTCFMRLVDIVLVVPFLPLMIMLSAFVGPSFWNMILVIGLLSWASPARIIRAQVMSIKTRGYIEAAKSMRTPHFVILYKHLLPGVLPVIASQWIMAASHAILSEASLSFLGLGDPLTKSWGSVLFYAQARGAFLTEAWVWWILPPGLLITTLVVGFAMAGYAVEEASQPRLQKGRM
ncbi:ABC transporter permease [Paenibacillus sp. 481]|uniref:ABC transporter permease n=1 Tax=Paenibacillus sp. 481 TaxID=2835869 RepID=UPI001E2AD4A4|nr:ABC transporter permease [Paenibacillus sp. 481]UHA71636.1 ABC transporter permease [Paenibacillus sp. 481]